MKKVFKMEELDCANCAAKMENAIRKINGVNDVTIAFMTQRMTLDADDKQFDKILDEAQDAVRRVDRECRIIR